MCFLASLNFLVIIFHCFSLNQSLITFFMFCISTLCYKRFSTSAALMTSTPFCCLAQIILCISYRAVYIKALTHFNIFCSLALARTTHYCLPFRTAVYYLISHDHCSCANFLGVYLPCMFIFLFYPVKHFYLVKCFIVIHYIDLYSIIECDYSV